MERERLVVRIKPEIKDEFQEATRENGSNMTVEVNRFIRNYLEQQKEKDGSN